ncbi:olfactory receptor 4Q3-like [Sceloporus undulatus]|uniref:olfactory receptor 4Q3-like n=1 Tax=Sceloporus undulatus TaxID=8520 RepID=UPI001C4C1373|nr:olfactory receptor 4Q3-like [Sceloporus undulatus]
MNGTTISEFILLGFPFSCTLQAYLSALVLACYIIILLGNCLILATVLSQPQLQHSPMFLFLSNLSLADLTIGSVAAPKLATDLFNCGHTISYGSCQAQLFFLHAFGGAEMLLLTLMAYDRYVAICYPLWYTAIMTWQRCLKLLLVCWAGGLLHSTIQMAMVAHLSFCGPNVLDNFYCDVPQVVRLACMDTYIFEVLMVVNSSFLTLPCFLILLLSYVTILATLYGHFAKGGSAGRALSTCSSHLMVVSLFYVPCVIVYVKPLSTSHMNKMVAVFYLVATPALNPFIYTLRNQEIKEAMMKLKHKYKLHLVHQKESV